MIFRHYDATLASARRCWLTPLCQRHMRCQRQMPDYAMLPHYELFLPLLLMPRCRERVTVCYDVAASLLCMLPLLPLLRAILLRAAAQDITLRQLWRESAAH